MCVIRATSYSLLCLVALIACSRGACERLQASIAPKQLTALSGGQKVDGIQDGQLPDALLWAEVKPFNPLDNLCNQFR